MKIIEKISIGIAFAVLGLIVISPVTADATDYEFESVSGWLFSPDQAAIEAITGQPSLALSTPIGVRYFVPGSMRGRFTYDPVNADVPLFFPPRFWAHPLAMTDWWSELEVGGIVIGTYTGDAGQVIIAEGNDGPGLPDDLVNVQMCGYCTNPVGFSVGDWEATGSGFLWAGEGFQEGIELPGALPPANAPEAISIFSFFNPVTGVNASILSFDASIWKAAQLVEIDIKPGSEPNCFNINGRGVIPVAILGSPDLDIAYVDQGTLKFGGLDVGIRGNGFPMCGAEDVDGDGYVDLVCQFEDDTGAWAPGGEEASLTGELLDGSAIKGTDSICLKP
jgi:hypothetical protein